MFSLWFYLTLNHADFNSLNDFMTFRNQPTNQTNKNRASVGKWTDFEDHYKWFWGAIFLQLCLTTSGMLYHVCLVELNIDNGLSIKSEDGLKKVWVLLQGEVHNLRTKSNNGHQGCSFSVPHRHSGIQNLQIHWNLWDPFFRGRNDCKGNIHVKVQTWLNTISKCWSTWKLSTSVPIFCAISVNFCAISS